MVVTRPSLKNEHMTYAGLGRRFLALLVDFLFFCLLFFPVTKIVKGVWLMSPTDHAWEYGWFITDPLCLAFLVFMIVYFIILEGIFGVTIGKKITGIRVVKLDGQKPGLEASFVRNILRIVDALPALNILGIVLIVLSPEKARFGDRIAGTRVIINR